MHCLWISRFCGSHARNLLSFGSAPKGRHEAADYLFGEANLGYIEKRRRAKASEDFILEMLAG
jgi:hypothetical protein